MSFFKKKYLIFKIYTENEIQILFDGRPTEKSTEPIKIAQIYLEQWKNMQRSH
jgi:hypothetical protein